MLWWLVEGSVLAPRAASKMPPIQTTELSKWRFSKGISATDPLQPEVVVRTLILRDHPDLIAHAYAGNIIRFATAARIFTTRRMTV
jgi:hypothetical protein